MFSRKLRLPFTRSLPNSHFYSTPDFLCKYALNHLYSNRYAFIVSKKVDKRAVVRNRVKRVFRSVLEEHNQDLPQGYDFIFILKKPALLQKRESFWSAMNKNFANKKLLKENLSERNKSEKMTV